jgi:hypothetical protein
MGTGYFPGVKRPGRDVDHSPPSSAEVKKGYSYTSIHPLGLFRPVTGQLYLYLYRKKYDRKVAHKPNTLLFKKPAVKYSTLVIYKVAPITEL